MPAHCDTAGRNPAQRHAARGECARDDPSDRDQPETEATDAEDAERDAAQAHRADGEAAKGEQGAYRVVSDRQPAHRRPHALAGRRAQPDVEQRRPSTRTRVR